MFLLKLLVLVCLYVPYVQSLKCYSCLTTYERLDQACAEDPDLLEPQYIECNKVYCTSVRVEYVDTRSIFTMQRGCDDNPQMINQVVETTVFRTYYKACKTDLCNGGAGKDLQSDSGQIGDIGEPIVLVVPGTGSGENGLKRTSPFIVTVCTILVILYIPNISM